MMTRLLVILVLVLQPLWAAGGLLPAPCGVDRTVSVAWACEPDPGGCCGPSGGCCMDMGRPCLCGMEEAPADPPKPRTPPASPIKIQIPPAITSPVTAIAPTGAERCVVTVSDAAPAQSHNQRQSLLCVWRT
jgi:hypothetical protein